MTISSVDFDYVRELVERESAIKLDKGKEYLAQARLEPLARKAGYADIGGLVAELRTGRNHQLRASVVDAMTTNETLFFRDAHPFEHLERHLLPEMIAARAPQRRLDIWCAAASTGQEPYSIVMLLRDRFPQLDDWHIRVLATDLSAQAIERARTGRYTQMEVNRGLPAKLLVRFFSRAGTEWQIAPEIRASVEFQQQNLAGDWPAMGPFDLVFMRNVLIYFSTETKRSVLTRAQRVLRPDGYLLLGATESTVNLDVGLERVVAGKSTCYRPRARALAEGTT